MGRADGKSRSAAAPAVPTRPGRARRIAMIGRPDSRRGRETPVPRPCPGRWRGSLAAPRFGITPRRESMNRYGTATRPLPRRSGEGARVEPGPFRSTWLHTKLGLRSGVDGNSGTGPAKACHSRESGNPGAFIEVDSRFLPAFARMTGNDGLKETICRALYVIRSFHVRNVCRMRRETISGRPDPRVRVSGPDGPCGADAGHGDGPRSRERAQ